jgi:hypothetical protein
MVTRTGAPQSLWVSTIDGPESSARPLALAGLLVGHPAQDAVLDQVGQPRAEHLPGRSGVLLDVVEPPDPAERLAEQEHGPPLAEQLEGPRDRAVRR